MSLKETGLMMTGDNIRRIINNLKVATRRPIKGSHSLENCKYGQPGDLLYFKETWRIMHIYNHHETQPWPNWSKEIKEIRVEYRADSIISGRIKIADEERFDRFLISEGKNPGKWRGSMVMPKDVARLWARLTDVKVERIQDITTEQIMEEGLRTTLREYAAECDLRDMFTELWQSIYRGTEWDWDNNPRVFALNYEMIEKGK